MSRQISTARKNVDFDKIQESLEQLESLSETDQLSALNEIIAYLEELVS
jgi:PleD family two-component response regulator